MSLHVQQTQALHLGSEIYRGFKGRERERGVMSKTVKELHVHLTAALGEVLGASQSPLSCLSPFVGEFSAAAQVAESAPPWSPVGQTCSLSAGGTAEGSVHLVSLQQLAQTTLWWSPSAAPGPAPELCTREKSRVCTYVGTEYSAVCVFGCSCVSIFVLDEYMCLHVLCVNVYVCMCVCV